MREETDDGEAGNEDPRPDDLDEILRLCAAHADYGRAEYDPAGKADGLREMRFGGSSERWRKGIYRRSRLAG